MIEFKMQGDVITLGQFLKANDIIYTGGYAKKFLVEQNVYVNDVRITTRGTKLKVGDQIKIDDDLFIIK